MAGYAYTIKFVNKTHTDCYFAVYQRYPEYTGMRNVAWKVKHLPRMESAPTRDEVWWQDKSYGLAIVNEVAQRSRRFRANNHVDCKLGSSWQLTGSYGSAWLQSMGSPAGDQGRGDQVVLKNNTGSQQSAGFTRDGRLVTFKTFYPGESAEFQPNPTFHVSLFRDIQEGELVTSDSISNPVSIEFKNRFTIATVTAEDEGGMYRLTHPTYSK